MHGKHVPYSWPTRNRLTLHFGDEDGGHLESFTLGYSLRLCWRAGTLAQDWTEWNAEFELYVAATGVTDKLQKRALLLHLAGLGVREIFKTYPADVRGTTRNLIKLSNVYRIT